MTKLPEKQQDQADWRAEYVADKKKFIAHGLGLGLVNHLRDWASSETRAERRAELSDAAEKIGDAMRGLV